MLFSFLRWAPHMMFYPHEGDISSVYTFLKLKFRTEIGFNETETLRIYSARPSLFIELVYKLYFIKLNWYSYTT